MIIEISLIVLFSFCIVTTYYLFMVTKRIQQINQESSMRNDMNCNEFDSIYDRLHNLEVESIYNKSKKSKKR